MKLNKIISSALLAGTLALTGCNDSKLDFVKRYEGVDSNGLIYNSFIVGNSFTDGTKPQIYSYNVAFSADDKTHVTAKSFCAIKKRTNDIDYASIDNLIVMVDNDTSNEDRKQTQYYVALTPSNTVSAIEYTKNGKLIRLRGSTLPSSLPFDAKALAHRTEDIVLETYNKGKLRN